MIIGLTGRFGAGCSTASKLLQKEQDFSAVSLSTLLKEKARKEIPDFDKKEENEKRVILQDLGDQIRKDDPGLLAKNIIKEIDQIKTKRVIIDSIRNPEEIKVFREKYTNFS